MAPPPSFLFLDLNRRCNLRCKTCFYWMQDDADSANYLSLERRKEILEEFAELNPRGRVVICGGEAMLDRENYFQTTRAIRDAGLRGLCVVNGTQIQDEATAELMLREGPHEITVSLNSHLAEVHDRSRGVPGSWDDAVRALRLLLAVRNRTGMPNPIMVMAIISELNYRELEAFQSFVREELGADKLKLNFLQPVFGATGGEFDHAYFRDHTIRDPEDLVAVLHRCDQWFSLGLNPRWIADVRHYLECVLRDPHALAGWFSPLGTERPICNSYERNIMVDLYGNARLCFSGRFPCFRLTRKGALRYFWESTDFIRERMKTCTAYCGISHSVRRESATLKAGVFA